MQNDFILILAWPETLCKQAGAWYDEMMSFFGFSKNNYYKVGHAAIVLVDSKSQNCHYFDFGRYHAPYGHGRIRDEETDHDLKIFSKAVISGNSIENIEELLEEIAHNKSCHGDGFLYASVMKGDFKLAYRKAKQMQLSSPWEYGPFVWKGTNCSRFVRTIALSAKPKLSYYIKLALPPMLTPTPSWNVRAIDDRYKVFKISKEVETQLS